jgi:hypothetical protein
VPEPEWEPIDPHAEEAGTAGRSVREIVDRIKFDDGELRLAANESDLSIYTSADDGAQLQAAVLELLRISGFGVVIYGTPQRGSWFRRVRMRHRDHKAVDKLAELAGKFERAAELKYIATPRSETDEREARAIAQLAQAMEGANEVVVRLSSVLFVKTNGLVLAWVLSEEEIRVLDSNPALLRSPGEIIESLPRLRQESRRRAENEELSRVKTTSLES